MRIFFKKKSPLTWTVLNSYNLLEVVNLSGSRHLRFLVSTKNTGSNDFYVSHIFLEVSHIPLWCLDTDICYGLKIQYGRHSPSWIGGSGEFYFRFWHFGTGSILIQKKRKKNRHQNKQSLDNLKKIYDLLEVVNFSGYRHLVFLVSTKNTGRMGFYVSHRYFRGIRRFLLMFIYWDMLWPQSPIWPPSAILDRGIQRFLF